MPIPEPNVVVRILRRGDLRVFVDGKPIVGQTRVKVDSTFHDGSILTIEVVGKLVRFEHENEAHAALDQPAEEKESD